MWDRGVALGAQVVDTAQPYMDKTQAEMHLNGAGARFSATPNRECSRGLLMAVSGPACTIPRSNI